jgi:short-subunit dehydrogenase involved in D-alanine esterification of teichoic acids
MTLSGRRVLVTGGGTGLGPRPRPRLRRGGGRGRHRGRTPETLERTAEATGARWVRRT